MLMVSKMFYNYYNKLPLSVISIYNCVFNIAFHPGKKAKSSTISIDNDLAVGLVDLAKLKTSMESTVSRLQLDFRDKLSTKVQPSKL